MSINLINPKISVLIAAYNVESTLDRALQSLVNQTEPSWEAIIVNDGSTDSTALIAKRWQQNDPRFRLINKQNAGYGAAMNCALDNANGTWLAILEPDDYFEPRAFEVMLKTAQRGDADIIRCAYWRLIEEEDGTFFKSRCAYSWRVNEKWPVGDISLYYEFLMHHPSIWAAIYRREYLRSQNIRFNEFPGAGWADNPFLISSHLPARFLYTNEPLYAYFEDCGSKAVTFARNNLLLPINRWKIMQDLVEELGYRDNYGICRAQIRRGITYCNTSHAALGLPIDTTINDINDSFIESILDEATNSDRELIAKKLNIQSAKELVLATREVYSRFNLEVLNADKTVNPRFKDAVYRVLGIQNRPRSRFERIEWFIELLGQTIYRLRCGGVKFTLRTIGTYLCIIK